MEKKSRKSGPLFALVAAAVLVILAFQYKQYQSLPKVASHTTVPVDGADNMPVNWRYFAIPYENLQSESDVEVTVSPSYNHSVSLISQKDIYLRSIEDERARLEAESKGRFDEFVDSYYPLDKRVTIERIGESYAPSTTYTITVINKPFNIFYYILGTKTKKFTFITGTDTVDELQIRKEKFESSLGTFLATVPTKEEVELTKKEKQICQLHALTAKPEIQTLQGKYYELTQLDCDTVNFTGETVTVKLLDPKGKAEFEQFLKDNNVNLSLLKITYITK